MVKKTSVSRVNHAVRSIAQVNGKPHLGKLFPCLLSWHLSPWSYRTRGFSGQRPRETDCTPGPSPPWQLGVTISKYVSALLVSAGTFLSPWRCWQVLNVGLAIVDICIMQITPLGSTTESPAVTIVTQGAEELLHSSSLWNFQRGYMVQGNLPVRWVRRFIPIFKMCSTSWEIEQLYFKGNVKEETMCLNGIKKRCLLRHLAKPVKVLNYFPRIDSTLGQWARSEYGLQMIALCQC